MNTKILILLIIISLTSCKPRNKLNSNEQQLAKQISAEEKEKQEAKAALKQNVPEIPDTFPPGFRFQEDRSVDPENPPILIDVPGTRENVREFKLSDVASSIKYIKLENPRDTQLLWIHPVLNSLKPWVICDDKYLFVQGLYGVTRYKMDGTFQEQIWKNESGINVTNTYATLSPQEFYGITLDNPVSLFNGNLFMRFQDGNSGQVQFIKKEVKDALVLNNPAPSIENKADTMQGMKLLTIHEKNMSRKYPFVFGISKNSWVGVDHTFNSAKTGEMLIVFNNNGDTLCTFSNPNVIKNWTKSLVRAGEPFSYYYKNQLTFLAQYSDTIFRLIPPNRLLPVYILDFGKDKIIFYEGINPDTDLSKKLMLNIMHETEIYLFIRYTRNDASPRNLKNKSVTFYNAIFNKNENKLYHFPEQSNNPVNFKNDIDGGISFWPEFVTPKGDMLMMTTGKNLKEYVLSNEFKEGVVDKEKRINYLRMVKGLKNDDKLIVVVN